MREGPAGLILVIGGLHGFVGSNTTEALVDQGQVCVVTRHKNTEIPRFLEKHIGHRVFVESADATSADDLHRIGEKHRIDGIVNVAGGFSPATQGPIPLIRGYFDMLSATLKVADEWTVNRVLFSSTLAVYFGLDGGPMREERPLPVPSFHSLVTAQKIVEMAASEFMNKTGISTVCARLGGMFGPWQNPEFAGLPARLVHAAVSGKPPTLGGVFAGYADDELDQPYIKDTARAIALLQTAKELPDSVYNVGSGRVTSNREVVEAVQEAVRGFKVELPPGRWPGPRLPIMDTERLRRDTSFAPKFSIKSAIRDYAGWLKSGNPK
jgi:UDP-glucose 4-epimerase